MAGAFLRLIVFTYLPLFIGLTTLAGCGLISRRTDMATQQPVAPIEPALETEEPPVEAEESETSPDTGASESAADLKRDAQEAKPHPPRKPRHTAPRHRPAPQPAEPASEPPAPAPVPPVKSPAPIITLRVLARDQTQELLDSEVRKPDGKIIGRAVDMAVDAGGKPREVTVNLNGFLGVGDRKMNFPWDIFRFVPAAKKAPITLVVPPGDGALAEAARAEAARAKAAGGAVPALLQLSDATVQRKDGSRVGRVVDILVDNKAQPQAVVLDVGGGLGLEKRSIAVDWPALHVVTREKALQLQMDLSEAQVRAAPLYVAGTPAQAVSPVVAPPASAPPSAAPPAVSPPAVAPRPAAPPATASPAAAPPAAASRATASPSAAPPAAASPAAAAPGVGRPAAVPPAIPPAPAPATIAPPTGPAPHSAPAPSPQPPR